MKKTFAALAAATIATLAMPALAQIKIGVVGPITGQYAAFGEQMVKGATMAVDEINAAGGVNGQKLQLLTGDDACDPKQATAVATDTASVAALGAGYSPSAYAVAKIGVLHLSKMAAAELAKFDIRVNAICPGFIKTNIFASALEVPRENRDAANVVIHEVANQAQPVKGGGNPEDIASMVAYLASNEARFITGTHMVVDGGITIGPRHSWDENAPAMFDSVQNFVGAAQE